MAVPRIWLAVVIAAAMCCATQAQTCADQLAKVNDTSAGMVGVYVPQCDATGNYEQVQCHGSTGGCWCADPITGVEIEGTSTSAGIKPVCDTAISPNATGSISNTTSASEGPCTLKLSTVNTKLVGGYIPQCDAQGLFNATQCQGSTGYCWCADVTTGEKIPDTEVRFQQPDCTNVTYVAATDATNATATSVTVIPTITVDTNTTAVDDTTDSLSIALGVATSTTSNTTATTQPTTPTSSRNSTTVPTTGNATSSNANATSPVAAGNTTLGGNTTARGSSAASCVLSSMVLAPAAVWMLLLAL